MLSRKKFLELAASKYTEINQLQQAPDMMAYERGLRDLMNELGRSIADRQFDDESKDRRKKKSSPPPLAK
ncbi:hypothetical protein GGR27_000004 [Lewinella antarctica]|uniref:Uncharacterized protein n=1 Tax=Neolewinella antarctica TaxID=442734 RepID=A0ABX0X676_9BACT|nr:hypothetical protein [Neolewinella antarctica]